MLGYKLEVDTAMVRPNKRLRLSDSIGSDTEVEEKITLKRNQNVSKTFTAVLKVRTMCTLYHIESLAIRVG